MIPKVAAQTTAMREGFRNKDSKAMKADRPRGSRRCWGMCGRTISANKNYCLECSKKEAAK